VIALERLRDLAGEDEWPEDPWVATDRITGGGLVERRLLLASEEIPPERLRSSRLARRVFLWRVTVYPDGAFPGDWAYRAEVAPDGGLGALRHRVDPAVELAAVDPVAAIGQAAAFLRRQGVDLEAFDRPETRSQQLQARTDLVLRYRAKEAVLGEGTPYGLQVHFAGDRLVGFDSFYDDPDERALQAELQSVGLWQQLLFVGHFVIAALAAVLFLRRYHAGEVGVRRGLQVFALVLGAALVLLILVARGLTEPQDWGAFTRRQIAWVWGLQFFVVFFFPLALAAALSWSVGESLCRERWSAKLAAFDALFQGRWDNATVARSALRGLSAGLALLGAMLGLAVLLGPVGVRPQVAHLLHGLWTAGPLPGLTLLALSLAVVLFRELFGRLFLLPWATRRLGLWPGAVVTALATGLLLFPFLLVVPLEWTLVLAVLAAAVMVALFLAYDLLTVLIASFTAEVGTGALALCFTDSPSLAAQGWLVFAVAALPAALSIRHLGSGREFVYRWDDVPPHVRRIAERERQRVELETARRIQSSILPELPPRLAGVDLAHAYLPATEVGGDFYDVMALADGRLAVALGDVAGHGVSSGLVMSAAKSALAVQVTFDPEVAAVMTTLNRLVYQGARRRLIATLCYALLDPRDRELLFASAGHLYPYVVGAGGGVRELASTAYPLGVRPELEVRVNRQRLEPGDTLVLLSDGIVEARREGSTELYGFERLEQSLGRHAGESVERLRDGILADVARFAGPSPREDDQTLLVLRLP
ncbi:MAG TPA: PP2C family protein-serine/threonine phosphatase, partial [Thermoanaerobaculia bacterium]|nr:PP2C family protein-serine/threonine phosphatase [Thermoanaerobaculia bacterium]